MLTVNRITRQDLLALCAVLLAAAVLRLGDLGITSFLNDEATLSQLAQSTASLKSIPLLGLPSSVGLPAPAASVYLLAIPYAVSDSPLVATAFVALLNVAGVGLVWLIAHRYVSRSAALAAGLVYAVNPWAVLYSRKIWTPDLHTSIILLAFLVGCLGFIEGRRWARVVCLPLMVFAAQVYMWALAMGFAFVWLVWLGRKHFSWREWGVSILITIVTLIPFAAGVAQTGLFSITNFFASRQEHTISLTDEPLKIATQFATGTGVEMQTVGKERASELYAVMPTPTAVWQVVFSALLVAGCVAAWVRYRALGVAITLWCIPVILVLTLTWTDIYPHYFVPLMPMFGVLVGMGVEAIMLLVKKTVAEETHVNPAAVTVIVGVLLGALLVTQGVWWRGMIGYIDTHYPTGGFGTPLHYQMNVRDALLPYKNVLLVTDDYWTRYDKEPTTWEVMLRNSAQCIRAIGGNGFAVFPKDPFAVLISPRAPQNPVNNLYQSDKVNIAPLRPGEGQYTVYIFDQPLSWSGAPLTDIQPVRFDNGALLTGYHLEPTQMVLAWTIDRQGSADFQYFGHFLNASGERIGQRDATFLPGRAWCTGDRLVTWIDIQLPEGVTTLRVGMYFLGQGADTGKFYPSKVVDDAGSGIGQWVDIPLTGNSAH